MNKRIVIIFCLALSLISISDRRNFASNSPATKSVLAEGTEQNPLFKLLNGGENIILAHTLSDTSNAIKDLNQSVLLKTNYEIDGNLVVINGRQYFVNAHGPAHYKHRGMRFPSITNLDNIHPKHCYALVR